MYVFKSSYQPIMILNPWYYVYTNCMIFKMIHYFFNGTYLSNIGVNWMMFLMLKINQFYHEYGVILLYIIVQAVI